jgi:glycosyltransferase involved in cell wall biosynthesis
MKYSVVIPTLNSEAVMGRALKAILAGRQLPDEILVVDGCSTDKTVEIASSFPVRICSNPKVHAAAARNVGIEQAVGDVIVFTDSDCVPQPDWLERIANHFETRPEIAGVGGRMLALPPVNDIEAFSGHVFLDEILRYPLHPVEVTDRRLAGAFITANCAYRKIVLEEQNGFRDEFGNNAEDIDLYWRLVANSAHLYYDPGVIVYHSFPKTVKHLMKKYFQHGIASSKLTRFHLGSPQVDWTLHRKLLISMLRAIVPNQSDRTARLYCCQLGAHIAGKAYGSFVLGIVNF